jgi:hypothetical protein
MLLGDGNKLRKLISRNGMKSKMMFTIRRQIRKSFTRVKRLVIWRQSWNKD